MTRSLHLSREAVYDLVWSTPLRTLAPEFGMADPTFRKRCEKANIPLPTAGHWAKLQAGKPSKRPPLPPRSPGMSHEIDFSKDYYRHYTDEEILGPIPDPIVFDEPIEDIERAVLNAVGTIRVPRQLEPGHPAIRRKLAEDAALAAKVTPGRYVSLYDRPRFSSAFEERGLRILSSLVGAFARLRLKVDLGGKYLREITVHVADTRVAVALEAVDELAKGRDNWPTEPIGDGKPMVLAILSNSYDRTIIRRWDDGGGMKLERQLGEIAAAIVAQGERGYREGCAWRHQRRLELKQSRLAQIERAREEAVRAALEREAARRQAEIDTLLTQAEAFARAETIRKYVEGARAAASGTVDLQRLDAWAEWALNIARSIDPIVSGAFLEN